jgi:hypothetical protein
MRAVVGITAVVLLATSARVPATEPRASSPAASDKKPDKPALTPGEKNLLRQGYRLEVRNGEKFFCRKEDTLGSRLHEHKVCGTEESISHRAEANNDSVRDSLKKSVINSSGGR